jgi:hypothetical protein
VNKAEALSVPSAEPRRFWAEPRRFGKGNAAPVLVSEARLSDPNVQAAIFQHRMSRGIRSVLAHAGYSLKEYVNDPLTRSDDLNYDRTVRLLRGESVMQFTDMFFWAQRSPSVRRDLAMNQFGWDPPAQ